MNAFLLMIPLFLIRFGLLAMVNKESLSRAAFFAPLEGQEKTAYLFYQVSNLFIILYSFFLRVQVKGLLLLLGLLVYLLGIVVLAISTLHFAKPSQDLLVMRGIYQVSRNPMYMGYFLYFLGCVLLTHSMVLFLSLLVFQISAHWIILSEERWCKHTFGNVYLAYMDKVRRYL